MVLFSGDDSSCHSGKRAWGGSGSGRADVFLQRKACCAWENIFKMVFLFILSAAFVGNLGNRHVFLFITYIGKRRKIMSEVRKNIVFHGRVQVVGFRYTAKYLSQSL